MSSTPNTDTPEYFSLLPSEIGRLILGYLLYNGHREAAHSLFRESNELTELRSQYKELYNLPMHLTQITLLDLIKDYLQMVNFVAHQYARANVSSCQLGYMAPLLAQLFKHNMPSGGAIRVPVSRPIRPGWIPTGKSYLPPRVVTQDRSVRTIGASHNSTSVRLPLVAVRPHLYTTGSVGLTKTGTVLNGPASGVPLFSTGPGIRPLLRLIRQGVANTSVNTDSNRTSTSVTSVVETPEPDGVPGVCLRSAATSPMHEDTASPVSPGPLRVLTLGDETTESHVESGATQQQTSRLTEQRGADVGQINSNTVSNQTENNSAGDHLSSSESFSSQGNHPTGDVPASAEQTLPDPMEPVVSAVSTTTNATASLSIASSRSTSPSTAAAATTTTTAATTTRPTVIQPATPLPFAVFGHLPPASETKRLSVGSDSDVRYECPTPSGVSRRRRIQTPRHVTSGQSAVSELFGGSDSQDDVDIQRFLSALFSKPEHLATHINAKLNTIPLGSDPPDVINPDQAGEPQPNRTATDSSDTRMRTDTRSPNGVSAESGGTTNPLLDLLENDLESCINQLLSEFDAARPTAHSDETNPQQNQTVNASIEVIDLMLPADASTPAYPTCPSVPNLWNTGSEKLDCPQTLVAPASAPVSDSLSPMPQPRRTFSPPLCLSQLAREVNESPVKRRRLHDPMEPMAPGPAVDPTAQLQTPNFKQTESARIVNNNEVPSHDLFVSEDRLKMYENCVRLGTKSMAQCTVPSGTYSDPSAPQSYLEVLPYPDSWSESNPSLYPNSDRFPTSQSMPRNNLHWSHEHQPRPDYTTSMYTETVADDAQCHSVSCASHLDSHGTTYAVPPIDRPSDTVCTHVPSTPEQSYLASTTPDASRPQAEFVREPPVLPTESDPHSQVNRSAATPLVFTESSTPKPALTVSPAPVATQSWPRQIVLQGLPIIPISRSGTQSSVATLVFYQSPRPATGVLGVSSVAGITPTIAATTSVTTSSSKTTSHRKSNAANAPVVSGPVGSLGNPVIFSLPQGTGVTWNASVGSTVVLPVNVDLDSPNPLGRSAVTSTSVTPALTSSTTCLVPASSALCVGITSRDPSAQSVTSSSSAASLDKENRPPFLAPSPVIQKTSRRKVLNLASIDVDQILSKSRSE